MRYGNVRIDTFPIVLFRDLEQDTEFKTVVSDSLQDLINFGLTDVGRLCLNGIVGVLTFALDDTTLTDVE